MIKLYMRVNDVLILYDHSLGAQTDIFNSTLFKQCNVASVCIYCVKIVQACEFSRRLKLMYRTTGHMMMQKYIYCKTEH